MTVDFAEFAVLLVVFAESAGASIAGSGVFIVARTADEGGRRIMVLATVRTWIG